MNFTTKIKKSATVFMAALITAGLAVVSGCAPAAQPEKTPKISNFGENGQQGIISFLLTDLPIQGHNVTGVIVNFRSIEIHSETDGWMTLIDFGETGQSFDLLKYQNGIRTELGAFTIAPGNYNQIRLKLHNNNYVELQEGEGTIKEALRIPSGTRSGIKLIKPFEITKQGVTTLTLDFDAQKSIHYTKGQGFTMKPVIKIIDLKTEQGSSSPVTAATGGSVGIIGETTIDIPAGALSQDTPIEIVPISAQPYNPPLASKAMLSGRYEFGPDGTQFDQDVTLTFEYDPAEVAALGLDENTLEVAYYDVENDDWISIGGTVSTATSSITANVNHFTAFGVMGSGKGPSISPAEILYAGYDPVTQVASTAVPEKISATVSPKKNTTITAVVLHINKNGQNLVIDLPESATPGVYEYFLDPAIYYPELSSAATPTFDVRIMVEAVDSAGNIATAPSKADPANSMTWHLYSYDPDRDVDGMNDRWEFDHGLDPALNDSASDLDTDGLTNLAEYQGNTHPGIFDATIGGTITGLNAGEIATLQLKQGETLKVTGSGSTKDPFGFITRLPAGTAYSVALLAFPDTKVCTAGSNSGTVASAHITNILVTCKLKPPPPSNGTWVVQSAGKQNLHSVTSFNGRYVALGHDPKLVSDVILTSADGANWSVASSRTIGFQWHDVAHNGKSFLAVGSYAGISLFGTSTDGVTWFFTKGRVKGTGFTALTVQNGIYYAVSNYGVSGISKDGANWLISTTGSAAYSFHGITSNGSRLIAVGQNLKTGNGIIGLSPDGQKWKIIDLNLQIKANDVTWTGTQFVAVGNYSGIAISLTSPDGSLWGRHKVILSTKVTAPPLEGVAWTGKELVAVGAGGTILRSTNGISWTQNTSNTINTLYDIHSGNSGLVAVGALGTIATNAGSATSTGWVQQTTNTAVDILASSWGLNQYVAVARDPSSGYALMLNSPDGSAWRVSTKIGLPSVFKSVAFNGKMFVAAGHIQGTGAVAFSYDGFTWKYRTIALKNMIAPPLEALIWTGTRFIAVGRQGIILTSPDGGMWYETTLISSKYTLTSIAHNGANFVITGVVTGTNTSTIFTSPGLTKFYTFNPGFMILRSVTWSGREYLITGEDTGRAISLGSPDGFKWVGYKMVIVDPVSGFKSLAPGMNSIAYSGNRWVAVGPKGYILSTTAPAQGIWSKESSPTTNELLHISTAGPKSVITGRTGVILTSNNTSAGTWSRTWLNTESTILAAAWGGKLFSVAGYNRFTLAGEHYYSLDGIKWSLPTLSKLTIQLKSMVYDPKRAQFVAAGDYRGIGIVATSKDGVNWSYTKVVTPTMTSPSLDSITIANGRYYAVGKGAIVFSADGLTWKDVYYAKNLDLTGIVHTGKVFVATGQDFATGGCIALYSEDAITWVKTPLLANCRPESITYSGSAFVIVGNYSGIGISIYSANGLNWKAVKITAVTATTTPTTKDGVLLERVVAADMVSPLNAVVWSGSEFIAAGKSGTILRSLNGFTWTRDDSGTSINLYDIALSPTHLLISADKGTVFLSPR